MINLEDNIKKFFKRKFDTLALKWRIARVFLDCYNKNYFEKQKDAK